MTFAVLRRGLLFVGGCKMAAQDTRTFIALAGDSYLCPLPQVVQMLTVEAHQAPIINRL